MQRIIVDVNSEQHQINLVEPEPFQGNNNMIIENSNLISPQGIETREQLISSGNQDKAMIQSSGDSF